MYTQQFPLDVRFMASSERAGRLERDEFIAFAMDEELYKRDASLMKP